MNPIRDVNYFALDLELNQNPETKVPKIIEVGLAVGNPTKPNDFLVRNWYVNPQEPLLPFITELTGITEEVIQEKSVPLSQVADEMAEILSGPNLFCNPVTWGQGDASELKQEFKDNGIDFPFFGRRIVDVKTLYAFLEQVNGRSPAGGLRKSMERYRVSFRGDAHRASVDALNTLRFYFFLMERQRKLESAMASLKTILY
jgi:ATP-dependent DNA helicase DinG